MTLALAAHVLGAGSLMPVRALDAAWHDFRLRALAPQKPDERLAIVRLDERALSQVGRWPWDRAQLADLVEKLFDRYGAKVVGLDLILAEPGQGDERLVQVLQRFPVVLGFDISNEAAGGRVGALPTPLAEATADAPWPRFAGYSGIATSVNVAAPAAGYLNTWIDTDGVIRRAPLLANIDGRLHGPFSLAVLRAALTAPGGGGTGLRLSDSRSQPGLQVHGQLAHVSVLAGPQGEVLVPFRRLTGMAESFSAADVMSGNLPGDALRGRVVLVGLGASGLSDLHVTPVSEALSGVQGHAAMVSAIWDSRVPYTPGWSGLVSLVVMGLALAAVWIFQRRSPAAFGAAAAAVIAGLLGLSAAAWAALGWALPVAAPVLLMGSLWILHLGLSMASERSDRREVELLFGQYVPPELVQRMSLDPRRFDMSGRSAELTVLFADLRGFTEISERLPPAILAALMNEFFSDMTDIVRARGGTLDKYIGDSVMAFWGAPLEDPLHALHAVSAAHAMQAHMPLLNRRFAERGWPALSLGIGINTGSMVVGDLGSRHRRAYTVIGDAVNVAARLQDLTSRLGHDILLGETTAACLGPSGCSFLGREMLRGRQEPVNVFAAVKGGTALPASSPSGL